MNLYGCFLLFRLYVGYAYLSSAGSQGDREGRPYQRI